MQDLKQTLISLFLENGIIGYVPDGITLKSGKNSHWYANCRSLTISHTLLLKTVDIVFDFIKQNFNSNSFDAVIGVPEGATVLGYEVNRELILNSCIQDQIYTLRVAEKTHGDPVNRFWVNGNMPKKVILLEDVTTTAGSVLKLAKKLKDEMNIEIVGIISLFNRLELDFEGRSVIGKMKDLGIKFHSIINASDILQTVVDSLPADVKQDAIVKINSEFKSEYGDNSPVILT